MSLRFKRSKQLAKGVKLNINKNSASITIGGKTARTTLNTNGGVTRSVSIPGTGAYISAKEGSGISKNKSKFTIEDESLDDNNDHSLLFFSPESLKQFNDESFYFYLNLFNENVKIILDQHESGEKPLTEDEYEKIMQQMAINRGEMTARAGKKEKIKKINKIGFGIAGLLLIICSLLSFVLIGHLSHGKVLIFVLGFLFALFGVIFIIASGFFKDI